MIRSLLAVLALTAGQAAAQETAAFLKVGVGARALGMGGAYTAVASGADAMAWNPAGLGATPKRELGLMDAELAADTRLDFAGYAQPTRFGTLGVGALRLSQNPIGSRDDQGRPTGSFTAADTAISLAYGAMLGRHTQLGASVNYIQSRIADASAQTFAVDLGGMRQLARLGPGRPLLGVAVQNLGPGMRFADRTDALPLALVAGLGYELPIGLTFAVDVRRLPNSKSSEISAGTEYALFSNFALRAGYGTRQNGGTAATTGTSAGIAGIAMGLGVGLSNYRLDYAMTPFGELGQVQRFSLAARF